MRKRLIRVLVLFMLISFGCQSRKDGAVEGTIMPSGRSATVSAMQDGRQVATISAEGKFHLSLAAGTYTISVAAPDVPYPVVLNDVVVKPGETSTLSPIDLAPPSGRAVVTGKIIPPLPAADVALYADGKERATVHTGSDGTYVFKELPAGTYEVRAQAAGRSRDAAAVVVADNDTARETAAPALVLLPAGTMDGVDWAAGRIRATGIGLPPQTAGNATIRRTMAERAAIVDGERNLLRITNQLVQNADQSIRDAMGRNAAETISGFVKGYTVVSSRELEGGKIEVVLELPLSGNSGLTRRLSGNR